jgi:hypothetical protein
MKVLDPHGTVRYRETLLADTGEDSQKIDSKSSILHSVVSTGGK